MAPGTTAVVPAGEPLLAPHLREDLQTVTFGEGGDVETGGAPRGRGGGDRGPSASSASPCAGGAGASEPSAPRGEREALIHVRPSFAQSHNLRNLLAAVGGCARARRDPRREAGGGFSALRGERIALAEESC